MTPADVRGSSAAILIVEDDDDFRRGLARILVREGFVGIEAASVAEAGVILDADPAVAAILCDVRMPGESGLDLVARLAADFPDLPVIMTTGVDDPQVADLAFELGVDGYLIKPFTTNELLITLTNALKRRRVEALRRSHVRGLEQAVTRLRTLTAVLQGIERPSGAESEDDTIERLSRAVSVRDEETGRHLERMSRYAAMLAEAVGYRHGESDRVRLATALHDVGKIGVPDTILLKPGPLSGEERVAMRRHATIGYQLLAGSGSEVLGTAAAVALGHHEWWDGGGYPQGLREDQIPEVARIAAVTDVFDALTSDRVYRPAQPVDEATATMRELRGRQFEPRLLDAFLDVADDTAAIRAAYPDGHSNEQRIRVLVVDDHEIFLQSVVRVLGARSDIKIVGAARTVAEAQEAATRYEPDVVLMDFELPDGDGVLATQRIKALTPRAKVVMLTGHTDPQTLSGAVAAGCAGFVTKTENIETLVDAIRAANEGELLGAAELGDLLVRLAPTRRGLGTGLRPREIEVLELLATGLSNKEIARRLGISLNTVRNHVQHILDRLDAHSRLEAVATAVREGIVERGARR